MAKRKKPTLAVETKILTLSRRRCCLCYGLNGDDWETRGQIAHLDGDPGNSEFDNLAFLCLEHHDLYDSQTSQSKGYTIHEVKEYRNKLYESNRERGLESVHAELSGSQPLPERLEESTLPVGETETDSFPEQDDELQATISRFKEFVLDDEWEITTEVKRAEQLMASGSHSKAADMFAALAERLTGRKQPVQARTYAKRAAEQYLAAGNKEAAAEQRIKAAEAWVEQTTYEPRLIISDIKDAGELAIEAKSFTLQARATLLRARLALLYGELKELQDLWQKAENLLPKVLEAPQVRLYCELALQRAMHARLHEEYEDAVHILNETIERDWSASFLEQRFKLLRALMFFQAEIGDWDAVDRTYQAAQQDLEKRSDRLWEGIWTMHYAGTLARRGEGNSALDTYMRALAQLEIANADVHIKYHLYQDMSHMLLQHVGFGISSEVLRYDSRRLDLALNVWHETMSARHIQRAEQHFLRGDLESAIDWGRAALILAWCNSSWSSANRAYQSLARLYAKNDQPLLATLAAVHAGDHKNVREYAEQAASTTDIVQVKQLIDELLRTRPTAVEHRYALTALAGCADVIPPEQLGEATDYALEVLSNFSQVSSGREASRRAAELLYELGPRFSSDHTNRVVRVCVEELGRHQFLIMQQELAKILGACFANKHRVDANLYEPALEALLSLTDEDAVKQDAEFAMTALAMNSSDQIRARIVGYFTRESNWTYLAAIGESVPDEKIRVAIESVLSVITPRWKGGRISYSGRRAQSITNFNKVLPASLYDFVVDGLLEAATNADGLANQRSGAIRTLRWLPEDAIRGRADHIAAILLEICDDDDIESEQDKDFWRALGGPTNQIVQGSLYALGHLYEWSSAKIRQDILERILSSSDHYDVLMRTGAEMALRRAKGSEPLPFQIAMAHERLLSDREPMVRHWAGAATGHLVTQPLLQEPNAGYFTERLAKLALSEEDAFARSGMAYGLRVIADNQEDSLPESVSHALERLANDVSYQVRRQAKSEREEG